jgi:serine/threonine protein kinase
MIHIDQNYLPIKSHMTKEGLKVGPYVLTSLLGKGQYGAVYKAKRVGTGEIFAIKKIARSAIDSNSTLKRLLQTEISVMHEINHPNIMHMYEFLASDNNYYIVMQFCNQGDLENYMRQKKITSFEESEAVYFLKQIMNGFWELRKKKILHRDFKLQNIFVHDERLIIGDFGFAKRGQTGETQLGSPLTMAPEILYSTGEKLVYNSKADLWSIGVVFYQILFGKPPFWGKNVAELKRNILENCGSNTKFPKPLSAEGKDLISRLLTMDPRNRIEWSDFFNHPLFKVHGPEKQTEIKKVFGPMGVLQSQLVSKEFDTNRKTKTSREDVQFLDDEDLIKMDPNISERPVNEEDIDESLEQQIQIERAINEVFFRYCHELNKIYFLVYSVHKIQSFVKENVFASAQSHLMNLSLLILKKGTVLAEELSYSIKTGANVFKLHDYCLKIFLKSARVTEVILYLETNIKSTKDHFTLITKRCEANKLPFAYRDVLNGKIDDKSINKYIANEATKMRGLNLGFLVAQDKIASRKFNLLLVILKCSTNLSVMFPYIVDQSRDPKFGWNGFYYTLERATNNELKILI